MTSLSGADEARNHYPEDPRQVAVEGQVCAIQMDPPTQSDDPEGGTFQLLLDSGDIIVSPYPAKWHIGYSQHT